MCRWEVVSRSVLGSRESPRSNRHRHNSNMYQAEGVVTPTPAPLLALVCGAHRAAGARESHYGQAGCTEMIMLSLKRTNCRCCMLAAPTMSWNKNATHCICTVKAAYQATFIWMKCAVSCAALTEFLCMTLVRLIHLILQMSLNHTYYSWETHWTSNQSLQTW